VLVRGSTNTEAPAQGDKYFAYLDSSGNELISLRDFEENYGAAPEHCGAFKDGVALLRDEYDEAYALLSSGEIRKLKYSPMFGNFGVGGFAIVDTDGDGCGDNLMDKWGRLLYAGDYAVRCCCSALSHEDCQWVAVTERASDLTSYFNLKTRCRTGFLYTDSDSRVAADYAGRAYLPVIRDGGLGVLGEDAKEAVPAVYETVIRPEGRRAYFSARRTVAPYGYSVPRVSLYDLDGNLLTSNDYATNFYKKMASAYSYTGAGNKPHIFTRLGYTYDWKMDLSMTQEPYGLSTFDVKNGEVEVEVKATFANRDFYATLRTGKVPTQAAQ